MGSGLANQGRSTQGRRRAAAEWLLRTRGRIVLAAHRLATRFEFTPPEFGREQPVDETDARAVLAEWVRYFRLWAAYNPEEVFALKVGAVLLLAGLCGLWLAIGALL